MPPAATDDQIEIEVAGAVCQPFALNSQDLAALERREQASAFHCVTTWTRPDPRWAGVSFRALYEQQLAPVANPGTTITRVRFTGADGYNESLLLVDALADDVLLADTLDAVPLSRGNGAPLRLVAPAHYGYKNVKYLTRIELLGPPRRTITRWLSLHHLRARVAFEERFLGLPGPVVRHLYRPMIELNAWWFRRMMRRR
jgi:DMSO/TMAO reductase YedYZ molybdopterin-dependent catalytic subunit